MNRNIKISKDFIADLYLNRHFLPLGKKFDSFAKIEVAKFLNFYKNYSKLKGASKDVGNHIYNLFTKKYIYKLSDRNMDELLIGSKNADEFEAKLEKVCDFSLKKFTLSKEIIAEHNEKIINDLSKIEPMLRERIIALYRTGLFSLESLVSEYENRKPNYDDKNNSGDFNYYLHTANDSLSEEKRIVESNPHIDDLKSEFTVTMSQIRHLVESRDDFNSFIEREYPKFVFYYSVYGFLKGSNKEDMFEMFLAKIYCNISDVTFERLFHSTNAEVFKNKFARIFIGKTPVKELTINNALFLESHEREFLNKISHPLYVEKLMGVLNSDFPKYVEYLCMEYIINEYKKYCENFSPRKLHHIETMLMFDQYLRENYSESINQKTK